VEDVNDQIQKCSMKVTSRKRNEQKNIYLFILFIEKYMPTRSKDSFPSKTAEKHLQ